MKLTKDEVLVLKTVKQAKSRRLYTEYEGKKFYYPRKGMVEAKDWLDDDNCGHGLHGLEWGAGDYDISEHGDTFVILKVNKTDGYVNLDGKVKFRRGKVVLVTKNNAEMTRFIRKYAPASTPVSMSYDSDVVVNQGYRSIAKQGSYSTAKQGDWSTAKQGDWSTATIYGHDYIYRNTSDLSVIIMFCNDEVYIFKGGKDYKPNETVLIRNCKIVKRYKHTPGNISELEDYEVFVFGSNLNGNHSGGAAKLARDKFGAVDGRGEGLRGQSYAFPTLGRNMRRLKEWRLKKAVEQLVKCACENTTKIFLVTKVGCGIAGYDEEYMINIFNSHWLPANIVLPKGWLLNK